MSSDGSSTPSAAIEFVDVVALIGSFPALAGVTMRIERGEIVLLRGPNGAGKTTLLRLCAGLLPVERGMARVLELDLTIDRDSVRRRVGLIGHTNGSYPDLNVTQNDRFWGRTIGATDDEVASAMARMKIDGRLADVPVSRLSAGQRRRTALASLIARRAQLWLLDEPHAGLDAEGRDELDAVLRAAAAAGATIVVASHELERAGSLATRQIEVVAGQTREVGGGS
ncbi:MAG: heme ABC exporter ATP-binding protein CcmA [Ilumatobacteraceae bacterium]